MKKEMLINVLQAEECRIAILEDGVLEELYVDRACHEGTPMIVEGVHVVPGSLERSALERCVLIEAVVAIEDEEAHRSHFSLRGGDRPAMRYLRRFDQIRKLLLGLFASTSIAQDPRRQKLIANVLYDFERLSRAEGEEKAE